MPISGLLRVPASETECLWLRTSIVDDPCPIQCSTRVSFARQLEICRWQIPLELGDRYTENYILSYLARAQAQQGDIAQAMTTFDQVMTRFREVGNRWGKPNANGCSAWP